MKFCPKCDNLLYSKNGRFYCKFCDSFQLVTEENHVPSPDRNGSVDSNKAMTKNTKVPHKVEQKGLKPPLEHLDLNHLHYADFFPYQDFRPNQEGIIEQIEESARQNKTMLLVAPNGTGKTIIALSALLPLAIERELKIIYLARTHSQNTRVIKELMKISNYLSKINSSKLKINGLSIRGRNEMCLNKTLLDVNPSPSDSMALCSDLRKNKACKHFHNLLKKKDKLKNPILISPELFNKPIDAENLIQFCDEKDLCPYFLSKFLLKEMSVIICNYQWIFNPFIRESFLKFIDRELRGCIIIVDECHNIIDVATDLNSDRITPMSLKLCLKDLDMYNAPPSMKKIVRYLRTHLEKAGNKKKEGEYQVNPTKFLKGLMQFMGFDDLTKLKNLFTDIHTYSVNIHEEKSARGELARDYLGSFAEFWYRWLRVYERDNYFFCYTVKSSRKGRKMVSLEIVALDPREIVLPILKQSYTYLNLTGTINPFVFNNLMGFRECGKVYKGIIAESPFAKKNIKALILEGIDTKRQNRTPEMYNKMITKIDEVLYCTPANVGIFCASYKILNGLVTHGIDKVCSKNKKKLFVEQPGQSASENAVLLDDFKSMAYSSDYGGVLLGVCGGRNSEGEDYPGGLMNSVIIAGFPYHLPTPRVNAKIEYYDKVFNNQGWNFAYLYPAVQRANQASGRPIRKAEDKGSIIFMDSRFKQKYKWISDWVRNQIEIIPDEKNAIIQNLYPFWKADAH